MFDLDGKFLRKFGSGVLEGPTGITQDRAGNVLVASTGNHIVCIFAPDGGLITKFGTPGTVHGEFRDPCSVCVDRHGQILVGDSQRVLVFAFEA